MSWTSLKCWISIQWADLSIQAAYRPGWYTCQDNTGINPWFQVLDMSWVSPRFSREWDSAIVEQILVILLLKLYPSKGLTQFLTSWLVTMTPCNGHELKSHGFAACNLKSFTRSRLMILLSYIRSRVSHKSRQAEWYKWFPLLDISIVSMWPVQSCIILRGFHRH